MDSFWYVIVFLFGAIVGSFLNVVIYRLHTGKSLGGRSHCLSCGQQLRWYELIPILSYCIQFARCRTCASYISPRYLVVELITASSFVFLWHISALDIPLFVFHVLLVSILIVISVYDIRHTIIPDELTIALGALAVIFLGASFLEHRDITTTLLDSGGGMSAALFFGGLWYISKGRWIGLGDAKLALPLGIMSGFVGVFSMVILSFWIGALVSIGLLGMQRFPLMLRAVLFPNTPVEKYRRYLTIKSEVPFAPFLILGFMCVYFFHADIFTITFFLFPL